MDEQAYWVALSLVNRPFDLRGLLRRFGSVAALFENVDARTRIGAPVTDDPSGALARARQLQQRCRDHGVATWSFGDPRYPRALRASSWPPPVLFAVGRAELLERPAVAIVGSRRCSSYGKWAARSLAAGLSGAGVCVVSGMAFGVDAAAHTGALDGPGGTVAVLGGGPERASPASLARLHSRLVAEQLVISEFAPGTPPRPAHYPRRNRIVAGLARATVVVEAAARSGALITAREALAEGRDVLAVPGPIDSPTSAGTNRLVQEGAIPVTGWRDVMPSLGLVASAGGEESHSLFPTRDPDADRVMDALVSGTAGIDELLERTGFPLAQLRDELLRLRLGGAIRACGGDRYCRSE